MLTAAEMLEIATLNGAHVAGLEDRTGSLTPGKQADVVLIDATALNMAPVHDPVAAVTLCADVSNVEHVLVAGAPQARRQAAGDVARASRWSRTRRDYLVGSGRRGGRREAGAARPRDGPPPGPPRRPTFAGPHPVGPLARATGLRAVVGRRRDARRRVHTGFGIGRLEPGGRGPGARALVRGERLRPRRARGRPDAREARPARAGRLRAVPVGVPHALRNEGDEEARFVRNAGPGAAARPRRDTLLVPDCRRDRARSTADVRDPRTRRLRPHHRGAHGSGQAAQELLASRRACAPRCSSTAGSP